MTDWLTLTVTVYSSSLIDSSRYFASNEIIMLSAWHFTTIIHKHQIYKTYKNTMFTLFYEIKNRIFLLSCYIMGIRIQRMCWYCLLRSSPLFCISYINLPRYMKTGSLLSDDGDLQDGINFDLRNSIYVCRCTSLPPEKFTFSSTADYNSDFPIYQTRRSHFT